LYLTNDKFNEIKNFIQGRYISASEAAWRLFKFPIQGHKPTVYRLAVHLPGMHSVSFNPNDQKNKNILDLLNKNTSTTLLAWFKLNETDPDARNLLYSEIPRQYTFLKKTRKWKRRKYPNLKVIGRVYSVHAKDSERFALRLLLNHVRGATSFEDIRTYNNMVYPTFHSAAVARNLIESTQEAIDCLEEAYHLISNPHKFREFFVQYLLNCSPQPEIIWNHFKQRLSEDILFKLRQATLNPNLEDSEEIHLLGLVEVKRILELEGSFLETFPTLPQLTNEMINSLIATFNYNMLPINNNSTSIEQARQILSTNLPKLNQEQRTAFDYITQNHTDSNLFNFDLI
jgi:hypothetical protein